jgi:hypothetical protein
MWGLVLFEVRQARPRLGALPAAACTVDERRVRSDDHAVMLVRLRPGDARLIGAVGRAVDSSEEGRRAARRQRHRRPPQPRLR